MPTPAWYSFASTWFTPLQPTAHAAPTSARIAASARSTARARNAGRGSATNAAPPGAGVPPHFAERRPATSRQPRAPAAPRSSAASSSSVTKSSSSSAQPESASGSSVPGAASPKGVEVATGRGRGVGCALTARYAVQSLPVADSARGGSIGGPARVPSCAASCGREGGPRRAARLSAPDRAPPKPNFDGCAAYALGFYSSVRVINLEIMKRPCRIEPSTRTSHTQGASELSIVATPARYLYGSTVTDSRTAPCAHRLLCDSAS